MAEIVPVTSEALEAQVRDLLPSQRGFGEDLQASNVITPIIDLTAAAQGTKTPELLQTAIAFGSQTPFSIFAGTVVLANVPGFYRIFGAVAQAVATGADTSSIFQMSDGLSTKDVWKLDTPAFQNGHINANFDFVAFLATGQSISAISDNAYVVISGSTRQIADVNGNLVNPSGFTPQ